MIEPQELLNRDWDWPFSLPDITAGLRRYFADPTIRVETIAGYPLSHYRPSIGRIRAFRVEYAGRSGEGACKFVVKEPRGTTRAGLAGAGRREVGVYRRLIDHMPVTAPRLIAASPQGDWLVLEALEQHIEPEVWSEEDYLLAVDALTFLHDRFWGLGEDLNTFAWLSRPLDADFDVHVTAARNAINQIIQVGQPKALAAAPNRMKLLQALSDKASRIITPLLNQPMTLLHGDYWPGNIAVIDDRSQVVFDWQLAGVGPGVMDLLTFANKSAWWFGDLPVEKGRLEARYRERIRQLVGFAWSDDEWTEIWDHSLMWRFLQEWVDLLALTPEPLLETRSQQLDEVWLGPVTRAVDTRLGGLD
jgi:hypothetical protein